MFEIKEDLNLVHLQKALNYPKTYYASAMEKVKRAKKDPSFGNNKRGNYEDYNLPPNPPLEITMLDMPDLSKLVRKHKNLEVTSDNRANSDIDDSGDVRTPSERKAGETIGSGKGILMSSGGKSKEDDNFDK